MGLPHALDQQRKKRTSESDGAGGPAFEQTRVCVAEENSGSGRSPAHPCGIDTIVLTRKLGADEVLERAGTWTSQERRNPTTGGYETWYRHDGRPQGWWIMLQPEREVLEVTLQVPLVMSGQRCNYPLRPFERAGLDAVSVPIARALGTRGGAPAERVRWPEFGVRSADFTIDVPAASKAGALRAFRNYPRSGKQTTWPTTVQWVSGGKIVRLYDKSAQLRAKLRRADYADLLRHCPEVERMIRFEVHLGATDLRRLFNLKSGWLPKFALVGRPDTVLFVLQREVARGFKLRRISRERAAAANSVVGLAHEIKEKVEAAGGSTTWSHLAQLALVHVLLGSMAARDLEEQFGISQAQRRKLQAQLRDLGIQPGTSAEPIDRRRLREFWDAFRRRYPRPAPRPQLSPWEKEHYSIDATWLDAPDVERSVEGLCVEDPDETAELRAILAGESLAG
jgi:hypothetical protein